MLDFLKESLLPLLMRLLTTPIREDCYRNCRYYIVLPLTCLPPDFFQGQGAFGSQNEDAFATRAHVYVYPNTRQKWVRISSVFQFTTLLIFTCSEIHL